MQERTESAAQRDMWRGLSLFVCYTLLLFASFFFNVFRVAGSHRASHIGSDSFLVLNRLHLAQKGGAAMSPLVASTPTSPRDFQNPNYFYKSQLGLQGIVLSAALNFSQLDPIEFAHGAAALFCLATSAVLAIFFVSIAHRLGWITAHLAVFATALSPILAEFSTSIFWSSFLMFAPLVATWMLYPSWSATTRGRLALAGVVFGLFFLKAACGYEYLTCIALSPLVAVLLHHALQGDFRRSQLWTCGLLFAACCSGFLAALALHAWQMDRLFHASGLSVVFARARDRTLGGDPLQEVAVDFQGRFSFLPAPLEYPVNCFLHYFTLPAFELPIANHTIPLFGPTLFCLGLLAYAVLRRTQISRSFGALSIGCGLALVASISWQVLVVNHMCVHFHLNMIVFWIPFMLLAVVALGWIVQQAAERWHFARPLERLFVPACLLLAVGNAQHHSLEQTARQTQEFRDQTEFASLIDHPAALQSVPEVVGFIDGVVERTHIGGWTGELARSSLIQFSGKPRREMVISGWAADTSGSGGPKKIVVFQGDQLLAQRSTQFVERPDVETFLKKSAPQAGFATTVVLPSTSNEPLRVFVLAGPNYSKAAELQHPLLSQRSDQSLRR